MKTSQCGASDQVTQMREGPVTHGPVLCLRSDLAAADGCTSSLHLSLSLSFMHRGHRESMTNFFSPPLVLFTSINFEKVILINFSHTEGQSYYYKQRYG